MRIAVLGASGGTGRAATRHFLATGHAVQALVRDRARLDVEDAALTVVAGDALRAADVEEVVAGADAVFVTLGLPASGADDEVVTVCTTGIGHVVASMRAHGIRRLVAMSTHGVNESHDDSAYVTRLWDLMGARLHDKETMEPLIRAAGAAGDVDWTIIRAPAITEGDAIGPLVVAEAPRLALDASVSHESLAGFVLDELVAPTHVGEAITLRERSSDADG
jgi:nucleoside-diphosphate-sugar epimerase